MKRTIGFAGALICVLVLVGCTAKKKLTADQYFDHANADFEDGAYQLAIDQYRDLLDQYPFSEHGDEAELRIAHAHFLAGNMPEAVAAFTDFQRRHPTSPHLPFVGYVLGLCYMQQMGTIDRDQSASQNAHNYFATVAQQYPSSPFAELAREQLAQCRENLAEHEMYIAEFYARQDNAAAAEMRLLNVVGRYDDTEAAPDALFELAEIYRENNDAERAALADAALAQRYPKHDLAKVARDRLAHNGTEDLLDGNPMPRLLADLPGSGVSGVAQPVRVPGLDSDDERRYPAPPSIPSLAPPAPFGGAGSY